MAWPKGDVKVVKEEKKRSSFENEKKQKLGPEIISLLTTFLLALKVWVFIFTKIQKFFKVKKVTGLLTFYFINWNIFNKEMLIFMNWYSISFTLKYLLFVTNLRKQIWKEKPI